MADVDAEIRRFAKSGVLVFAGTILELVLSFFGKVILAQYVDVRNFGVISLGLTVVTVVGAVSILGLHEGIARNYPRFSGTEAVGVLKSSFYLGVASTVVAGAAVFLLARPIAIGIFSEPRLVPVLQVYAFVIPFAGTVRLSISATQAVNEVLPKIVVNNVLRPTSRLLFIGAAAIAGFGLLGTAFVYVLPLVLGGIVSLYFVARYTPLFEGGDWSPMFADQLRFSLPLVVAGSISFLMGNADTFMIGYFLPSASVGVYNIAYTLAQLLTVFLSSLGFLAVPLFSQFHDSGDIEGFSSIYSTITKWAVFATVPAFLVFFFFPNEAISLTFGVKYVGGSLALRIIAVGFFVSVLVGHAQSSLTAVGRTRFILYGTVVASVLNVCLNFVLIPRMGIAGAAISTATMYITLNVLFLAMLYSETGISPISPGLVRPLLLITPVVTLVYLVFDVRDEPLVVIGSLLVGFAVIYAGAIFLGGGIGKQELMIIRSIESRYGLDLGLIRQLVSRYDR